MKLRAIITIPRNGNTVHPGESFRVEPGEVDGLVEEGKAEHLTPMPKPRLRKAQPVRTIVKAD